MDSSHVDSGQCLAETNFDGVSCTDCVTLSAGAQSSCLENVDACTFDECASAALAAHLASGQCLHETNFDGVSCADCGSLPAANQEQCLDNVQTDCAFDACSSHVDPAHVSQCLDMTNFDDITCTDCAGLPVEDQSQCIAQ